MLILYSAIKAKLERLNKQLVARRVNPVYFSTDGSPEKPKEAPNTSTKNSAKAQNESPLDAKAALEEKLFIEKMERRRREEAEEKEKEKALFKEMYGYSLEERFTITVPKPILPTAREKRGLEDPLPVPKYVSFDERGIPAPKVPKKGTPAYGR